MVIYGSMLCPDCVECRRDLDAAGKVYTFCDFSDDMAYLKAFLKIRDQDPIFDGVKKQGKIGIPCIVHEDGTVTLDWK